MSKKKETQNKAENKSKMGRPVIFDTEEKLEQLKQLMRLKPSLADTAAFFQCGATTVSDTIQQTWGITFREFRNRHFVHTRLQLQRDAVRKAKHDWNAHKFCLENYCGWSSNQKLQHSGLDEGPIEVSEESPEERKARIAGLVKKLQILDED